MSKPLSEDIFSLMILRLSLVMFVPSRMATSPPLILQEKGKAKEEGGGRRKGGEKEKEKGGEIGRDV